MTSRIWATSDDGTIDFISLTPEYMKGAFEVLKTFYKDEVACKAVGIPVDEGAMSELDIFNLKTAKDGLSVIAVERKSNKVCGVAFNKLQVRNNSDDAFFENFAKSCKHPASKAIVDIMIYADAQFNLFDHCNVDCLLELTFLGTLPEFRHRGIAKTITEVSTELATRLFKGENVKQPIDGEELSLEPVPKIIIATFSSPYSKKIGRALNWEIATVVNMKNFLLDGKPLEDLPDFTLEFKRLG